MNTSYRSSANRRIHSCLIGAFIAACIPLVAHAQAILLGTLPMTGAGNSTMTPGDRFAFSFTTPATAYTLNNVIVPLFGYDPTGDTVLLGFYTDTGVPGTLVGSLLTNPAGQGAVTSDYTFTPASTITFSPNTTYWMVFGVDAGTVYFQQSSLTGTTPIGDATFGNFKLTGNSGANWFDYTATMGGQFEFQINATAVPEPSTYAALTSAAVLVFAAYRRRQKQSA
jgi:hypothetical protein